MDNQSHEQGVFMDVFRNVRDGKSEIGDIMSGLKDEYGRLKNIGFTKADIKWAQELDEKDSGEIIATMKRRLRIAEWMGHSISRQMEMFDEDRTPLEERAAAEGLAAGKLRKDNANPYDMGSAAGQAWQKGFNDGTAFANQALADAIGDGSDG